MSDKISTQNMSTNGSGLSFTKRAGNPKDTPPMPVVERTVFTDKEREELREIFHSVLEEYGLVRRMSHDSESVEERLQKLEEQAHPKPTGATQKRNDDRIEALQEDVKKLIDK